MSKGHVIVEWNDGRHFAKANKPIYHTRTEATRALAAFFKYDYYNKPGAKEELKDYCRSQGRMKAKLDRYSYNGKHYVVAPVIDGAYITPCAPRVTRDNRTTDDLLL